MSKKTNIIGKKFGKLIPIKEYGTIEKQLTYECICECGNKKVIKGNSLKSGNTKTCGCSIKVDLTGYENDECKVLDRADKLTYWNTLCKGCGKIHTQNSREIRKNSKNRDCKFYKPHNWSGLERTDMIMRREYGITLNEYHSIIKEQGGGCYICGRKKEPDGRRLSIDHDHDTNKVRGVLCYSCNKGLGLFYDNINSLEKAILYLKNPPYQNINN